MNRGSLVRLFVLCLLGTITYRTSAASVIAWGDNTHSQLAGQQVSDATAVAAGAAHTTILRADGTVVTWGSFYNGIAYVPATNPPVSNVVAIASGFSHSLALMASGTVLGWGYDEFGAASPPSTLTAVKQISAGGNHSLALGSNGTVVAWGRGTAGSTTVPGFAFNAAAIAAGQVHNLTLQNDGIVYGWGANYDGQATGVPTSTTQENPYGFAEGWVLIGGSLLRDVKAVAAGGNHSLALKSNGTVVAWGRLYTSGWASNAYVPAGLANVVAISAGGDHDIALLRDGSVVVWGANDYDQALPPSGIRQVTAISAGHRHKCGCWISYSARDRNGRSLCRILDFRKQWRNP